MILTTTMNPSVDISYPLENLTLDGVNRVENVSKTAGGKGLNVARVLKQLDENVAATGYLGGELGAFITAELHSSQIEDYFVAIKDATRNCIAIIHEGMQTEVLESGPEISEAEAAIFIQSFKEYLQKVNYVTISGSLPKGLPSNFYATLVASANKVELPVLLDTSGKALEDALKSDAKPFLIKPNVDELSDLIGREVVAEADIIAALQTDLFAGVTWVVVTLGAEGALIKQEESFYRVSIPKVVAVNPVGSGDAVIAGFAAGLSKGLVKEELMRYGLTMGTLNAMEAKTGFIDTSNLDEIYSQILVKQINE